jgi:hypothetical protein
VVNTAVGSFPCKEEWLKREDKEGRGYLPKRLRISKSFNDIEIKLRINLFIIIMNF